MSTEIAYDYRPEVKEVLTRLIDLGFKIEKIFDGEEYYRNLTLEKAVEQIMATEESYVYFEVGGKVFWVGFIIGNEPGHAVFDHSWSADIEEVVDAVYEKYNIE